jgi:hypothetical protein
VRNAAYGRILLIGTLIALIAANLTALSAAPAGRVEAIQGRVILQRRTANSLLEAGEELFEGDRLISGNGSSAILKIGQHRLRLGPAAHLLIMRANEGADLFRLSLQLGRLWACVQKGVTAAVNFRVETPAAIAGVRGTLFSVSVAADGTTWVGVSEGIVDVASSEGGGMVRLPAGSETTIHPGDKPEKAKKIKKNKVGGDDLKKGDGQ